MRKSRFVQALAAAILAIALFSCQKEEERLEPVRLEPVTLESIEVTTLPAKTEYLVGEEFEPAGMVLAASYSDNTTALIDIAKATFIFNFSTTGAKTIMVAYEGKTTNFRGITVKKVTSITLNTPPTKTTYVMGEAFDPAGMVVFASFDDLSMASIALSALAFTYDFSDTGTELTLTIHYAGQTTTFDGITVVPFAGGGIDGDPFLIGTAAQLAKLAELVNAGNADYRDKHYKLTAEIDLSAYGKGAEFNDGKGWIPIGSGDYNITFLGNFDGGSHAVSGLYINDHALSSAGLFGRLRNGGSITNLGVLNVDITGDNAIGGMAGSVLYDGSISNCYVTGTVSGNRSVGGVAGEVGYSSITNCYATVAVSGNGAIGGVAGWVAGGSSITNCYATGAISGNGTGVGFVNGVGGVVGGLYEATSITNCAALNPSIRRTEGSDETFGRVVGQVTNASILSGNIALNSMDAEGGITFNTGAHNNEQGLDVSTAGAKIRELYTTGFAFSLGWNFNTVWHWGGASYPLPVLQWQTELPKLPEHLN